MRIASTSLLLVAVPLLALLCAGGGLMIYYHAPYDDRAREVFFPVQKGESFRSVSRNLAQEGLLRRPELFDVLARLQGLDQRVKAGEYLFDSSWSPARILDALCRGTVVLRRLTVPEGLTFREIAVLMGRAGLADPEEVLRICRDPDFVRELGLEGATLEGYLFPDTYHFAPGLPARELLDHMVDRFREVYDSEMQEKQQAMGLTLLEVVTLASIVEKESGHAGEKPLVASVLHNRLVRRMLLQCDPTVVYGIEGFEGRITRSHLRTPHPYNTYIHPGLPPGPIANPGLDSLRAVLEPAETNYLYFVSRNDGSHQFSTNLRDHNRAVSKYQRGGR